MYSLSCNINLSTGDFVGTDSQIAIIYIDTLLLLAVGGAIIGVQSCKYDDSEIEANISGWHSNMFSHTDKTAIHIIHIYLYPIKPYFKENHLHGCIYF